MVKRKSEAFINKRNDQLLANRDKKKWSRRDLSFNQTTTIGLRYLHSR